MISESSFHPFEGVVFSEFETFFLQLIRLTIDPVMAVMTGHAGRSHSSGSCIVSNHFHPSLPPSSERNNENPKTPRNNKIKLRSGLRGKIIDVSSPTYPTIPNRMEVSKMISLPEIFDAVRMLEIPQKEKNSIMEAGTSPVINRIL